MWTTGVNTAPVTQAEKRSQAHGVAGSCGIDGIFSCWGGGMGARVCGPVVGTWRPASLLRGLPWEQQSGSAFELRDGEARSSRQRGCSVSQAGGWQGGKGAQGSPPGLGYRMNGAESAGEDSVRRPWHWAGREGLSTGWGCHSRQNDSPAPLGAELGWRPKAGSDPQGTKGILYFTLEIPLI